MRLEAVIVGGIADHAVLRARAARAARSRRRRRPTAAFPPAHACRGEQISEQFDFGLVGDADQRRVVAVERNVFEIAIFGLCVDGIDGGDEVVSREVPALVTLHAEPDNDNAHGRLAHAKLACALDRVDLVHERHRAPIGTLPSLLAFAGRRDRAEDRRDHLRSGREHASVA